MFQTLQVSRTKIPKRYLITSRFRTDDEGRGHSILKLPQSLTKTKYNKCLKYNKHQLFTVKDTLPKPKRQNIQFSAMLRQILVQMVNRSRTGLPVTQKQIELAINIQTVSKLIEFQGIQMLQEQDKQILSQILLKQINNVQEEIASIQQQTERAFYQFSKYLQNQKKIQYDQSCSHKLELPIIESAAQTSREQKESKVKNTAIQKKTKEVRHKLSALQGMPQLLKDCRKIQQIFKNESLKYIPFQHKHVIPDLKRKMPNLHLLCSQAETSLLSLIKLREGVDYMLKKRQFKDNLQRIPW